jgi:hypothetical protein
MILDGIKKSENAISLPGEVAAYVENAYHDLARFDVRAFEINRQEFATRNVRALCQLLNALAFGLMAKLDVKGYDADVTVTNLVALKPDKITSSISTTVYILLKTCKEERKLTELPAPTMPANNIRGPWNAVNNLARPGKDLAAEAVPPAPTPTPAPPPNVRAPVTPTPNPVATSPTPAPTAPPGFPPATPIQQAVVPLVAMNLTGYPDTMTVAQLIQGQQMAGTLFVSANGTPVLYLMPPPPALPTLDKPGGGANTTNEQYQHTQETKRIIAAITPVAPEPSAKDIEAKVSEERVVTPKNLRGTVRLEANKITKDLEHKVALLQTKLDKQGGCANGTKKSSKGKKDFRRSGKSAATDLAAKTGKGVGGPGNATSSTAKGPTKG